MENLWLRTVKNMFFPDLSVWMEIKKVIDQVNANALTT